MKTILMNNFAGIMILVPMAMAQSDHKDVRILHPDSPEFASVLKSFPGKVPVEIVDAILPYSLILENVSSRPILSVVMRVEYQNPEGKTVFHEFNTYHRGNDPRMMLQPGVKRFISPDPTLNRIVNSGGQLPVTVLITPLGEVQRRLAIYGKNRLTLDSVIFADGEITGPDKSHVQDRFNVWAKAEQEILNELRSRRNDPAAAKQYLQQVAATPEKPAASGDQTDHYGMKRIQIAERLLRDMDHGKSHDAVMTKYENEVQTQKIPKVERRQP